MTADNGHEGRTLASLAFALGLWATVLGLLNIMFGIGGTAENKLKVVWAAYLSVGQLYPHLYVDDMVFRPASDSVFMILSIGLMAWGGRCLHNSTEGGIPVCRNIRQGICRGTVEGIFDFRFSH